MNKILLTVIPLLLVVFIGGFMTAKHFYQNNQDKTTETDTSHTKTHTVVTTLPNGTTTTVTDSDTTTKDQTTKIEVIPPKTNVSLLVANDFSRSIVKPVYGVSVTHEVLGNLTVGAFGLANGTAGLSIGYNF